MWKTLARLNGVVFLLAFMCLFSGWFSAVIAAQPDLNAYFANRPYPKTSKPVAVGGIKRTPLPGYAMQADYAMMMPVKKGKPNVSREVNLFAPTWSKSYQLYKQPHALWLASAAPSENITTLQKILKSAVSARQVPEIVVYAIPNRDMNQASAGGVESWQSYLSLNKKLAAEIRQYHTHTGERPAVYLEPDSIAHAIQYMRSHQGEASQRLYTERLKHLHEVVNLYTQAGANVYLDAAHSDWFGHSPGDIAAMADALNLAGVKDAAGIATNISNRQKINDQGRGEQAYIEQLVPLLDHPQPEVVVDTSRNGGDMHRREYYLAPDHQIYDNETANGRVVGTWRPAGGDIQVHPYAGHNTTVSQLEGQQYNFDRSSMKLVAPIWMDPAGAIIPGPAPTDNTGIAVIHKFRYIKPPDEADGSLNYPPGISRHDTNQRLVALQDQKSGVVAASLRQLLNLPQDKDIMERPVFRWRAEDDDV